MIKPSTEAKPPGAPSLEDKITAAWSWALLLGGLGMIASILQFFDFVEAEVPAWVNLLISASAVALGLVLRLRSLWITSLLLLIYIVIITDTIAAARLVLEHMGAIPTALVVIRTIILLNAAKSAGQVFAGIIESRKRAANQGLLETAPAGSGGFAPVQPSVEAPAAATAPERKLSPGSSVSAIYFGAFSGLLALAACIFGLAVPLKGMGAVIFGFMACLALLAAVAAYIESRYLTSVVNELRRASAAGDAERCQNLRNRLVQMKRRGGRGLAISALELDPDAPHEPWRIQMAKESLDAIAAIGELDRDAAQSIYGRFLHGRNGSDATAGGWGDVFAAARAMLEGTGYEFGG